MLLPVINMYCMLKEGTLPLDKTFTFHKNINRFKIYVNLILFQILFCIFSFIHLRRYIHSRTVRRRLHDVGISAVDRFTYQLDNTHGQKAKFDFKKSQQNNVTCIYHLERLRLNTFRDKLCYCVNLREPKPKTLKKNLKTFLQD